MSRLIGFCAVIEIALRISSAQQKSRLLPHGTRGRMTDADSLFLLAVPAAAAVALAAVAMPRKWIAACGLVAAALFLPVDNLHGDWATWLCVAWVVRCVL